MAPKRRGTRLRFPLLSDSQPLILGLRLLCGGLIFCPQCRCGLRALYSIAIHSADKRFLLESGIFSVKYSLLMIGILENPLYGAMLYQKQLLTYTKKEKENVTYT